MNKFVHSTPSRPKKFVYSWFSFVDGRYRGDHCHPGQTGIAMQPVVSRKAPLCFAVTSAPGGSRTREGVLETAAQPLGFKRNRLPSPSYPKSIRSALTTSYQILPAQGASIFLQKKMNASPLPRVADCVILRLL